MRAKKSPPSFRTLLVTSYSVYSLCSLVFDQRRQGESNRYQRGPKALKRIMKAKRTRTVSQKTSSARSKPTPSSLRPEPAPEPEAPVSPLNRPKTVWIVAAVLVGVVFICFADALWNGFVFDDHVHVLDNILVRSLTNLPSLVWDYRPLRDVSYAFDFAIFGDRPFGFHLTNILIHAANTVLVFLLIRRITDDLFVSCLSALLFAVHPIQTDSVAYISGRRDVLFTLFYLAADFIRAVVSGEMRALFGKQRMERLLAELNDHLIVCGYGRMGKLVCREFVLPFAPPPIKSTRVGIPMMSAGRLTCGTLARSSLVPAT